ncbi:MAG: peptide deformylase [Methylotenera sp.]|uniref:peptide deformylase n=2 Tax=Methylotenera sp. TaxID=2051956 RepID=UPI00271CEBB9|nr:peptide deformylase [Methylotenera sp.]MDO9205603.1 peptide deformylase [Methylotenera sp.]MDO9393052.1 peptide deformylase [Methylotenera sp.]MDP1523305.1 peptide deformylase [Methylotenera sp.]MDP2071834.1 peptide deformylase [Methylotenera sp.]MDP3817648.1 peptide deformylase [Methylotenera sp.]
MGIKSVLRMGEPCLLVKAVPVEQFDTPELHALIQDLEDTMLSMNGAGIAAPQIGESLRVVIFGQKSDDESKNPRYPDADAVPYTVLINPVITLVNQEMEDGWEGCLSVPGMRGIVPRYMRLHYAGFDQYGNPIDRLVSGFHARVVQHECDHLDGVLYPMRIVNLKDFGYTDIFSPNQDVQDD